MGHTSKSAPLSHLSSPLLSSPLLSFFAGVKSKEEDRRFTNPDPSNSRDLKRKRSVTFVDVDHHRNHLPQAQTRPSAIDAKTSEFASGFLGLSSNQSSLFYPHQSPLFRSADPQTCPAESGVKCSGSGEWEGEFFPEIPHIKYEKMSEMMDSFENQFVNMEVQAEFIENAMAGSTSLSEGDVNHLMQQILLSNSANSNRKRLLRSRNDPSSTFLRLSL
ncbi:hypothetical protein F2Q70_00002475 [Brassica cretica]|uniref:Uncharacterized protein n=1 Tax=Brassica cretica TaxID=69181 RepID=A0A8S9IX75_BRACR|nr:hypothetical protein F2Q70_00002475 [Brassica cretica]